MIQPSLLFISGLLRNNIPTATKSIIASKLWICRVLFRWRNEYRRVDKSRIIDTLKLGVVAQELQKVFPNAVTKDKDGYLRIRQEDMFYAMINAIKELDLKWKNRLTNEILDRGFKNVKWQGRFETISKNPLIVIDGCHNIDGVKRVCDFVKNLNYSYKRAVISISADKELKEMTSLIAKVFDEIVITKYSYMRSSEVDTLNELLVHPNKKIIKSVQDALDYCHKEKCELTVFLGSLYLVSEVYNLVKPLK